MSDDLADDLARLVGVLDGSRVPGTLTDAERLRVAELEARLILRRLHVGVYRPRGRRPGFTPAERN